MDAHPYTNVPPLIEILVHTSASSGARDDVRYRAQAAAYLDFEPCHSNALSSTKGLATIDTTLAGPLSAEGIDRREALLGSSSDAVGSGNGKRDVQFWNTVPETRIGNSDADLPRASGSTVGGAAIKCGALDRGSHTIVTLQSTARFPSGTKAPLNDRNAASRKGEPMRMPSSITPDIQPLVHVQMNSSSPEHTTAPRLPSPAKRQRIQSPDRLARDGRMKANELGAEHPCHHSFNITKNETEQRLLNCGACKSGPHQHVYQCNNCMSSLCGTCHTAFLQDRKDQTVVTTPTPSRKARGRPPRRVSTLSPPKGRNESTPLLEYVCYHSYDYAVVGPSQSLLVCTTCSITVPDALKCTHCVSTLCRRCHDGYAHSRVRSSSPKPGLLAQKESELCATLSPPPPPSQLLLADPSPPLPVAPPQSPSYPPLLFTPPPKDEIHPPPPPTSNPSSEPPPIITASFSLLATRMPLQKYFVPVFVGRRLRPMERGHWRIYTTTWDGSVKEQFWRFLEEFVGDGRAGWGVWVSRVIETGDGKGVVKGGAVVVGVSEPRDRDLGVEVVRVYCWGDIVGYVWLLLFITSDRRVKGSECCWIDGGEQAVIRMA
ncbi:MAG: hypothetical protein M1813_002907 [Trichoglossum hirsutum]|nr:MAG: hypothetical protein M1813_002907 [Trichoglossum hirsutum]